MKKQIISVLTGMVLVGSLVVGQAGAVSTKKNPPPPHDRPKTNGHVKEMPPIAVKRQNNLEAAAEAVSDGAPVKNGRVRINKGQANAKWVEYGLEGEEHIVTMLVDFTDPQHGQIEEPDRETDNSTYWVDDFSSEHFEDMLFAEGGGSTGSPSMRDLYLEMSSGRYTVNGQVGDWISLDQPESEYGANDPDGVGDDLNGDVYRVVGDALAATAAQDEGIDWSSNVVDVWDRYDCDLDGIYDEADGYVDHFQLVHAGQGEEEGGGAQGEDAIWSHRWYANFDPTYSSGPSGVEDQDYPGDEGNCPFGGYEVPGTGIWVGDYTIEPENGAVGVFAHEYAHDLGLPDLYDTSGGENGTSFWTLMSGGSWASTSEDSIGDRPTHMDAWSKYVSGWLGKDLKTLQSQEDPQEGPDRRQAWSRRRRHEGSQAGDQGRSTRRTSGPMSSRRSLRATTPTTTSRGRTTTSIRLWSTTSTLRSPRKPRLDFRTWYFIEEGYDYGYIESFDGTDWAPLPGPLSDAESPYGIDGDSGGEWMDATYMIPAGSEGVRFRYVTDGGWIEAGFFVDSISLAGEIDDNGSQGDATWDLWGFSQVTDGVVSGTYGHYYLIESRNYLRGDKSLKGAYNFIDGNWLEKTPYADGVLIWYRDQGYADNNTSVHPGHGQVLPVDSHPATAFRPDGDPWRTRWQSWDSTFGNKTHKITLTQVMDDEWVSQNYTSKGINLFNDKSTTKYWNEDIPEASTMTAGSGLKVKVMGKGKGGNYRIKLFK